MGDIGDYWRDVKEYYKSKPPDYAHERRQKKFWKEYWAKVKEYGFDVQEFANGHTRITNGNKSFDFWKTTETVKCLDGSYDQGWTCLRKQLELLKK